MTVTFLVGGARSGKSRFAVEFGRRHEAAGGTVSFVATAPRLDDADWAERIDRHIAERPAWRTIEEPVDLVSALRGRGVGTPAILITTNPSVQLRRRADEAGLAIVEKPLLGNTLAEAIRSAVAA